MDTLITEQNILKIHYRATECRTYYKKILKINKQLISKFGTKYTWQKAYFLDENTELKICCKTHGYFKATTTELLNRKHKGCPKCQLPKKKPFIYKGIIYNRKSFIQACEQANGDKFDYSQTVFRGFKTPIIVKCKKHSYLRVKTPHTHLTPTGCPKCRGEKTRLTTKEFVQRAIAKHGTTYLYTKSKYKTARDPIIVTCRVHGDFTVNKASDHYINGTGCPKCNAGGFQNNLPGMLYYLSINNGQAYKIGITNSTVQARFGSEFSKITILATWYYENGKEARNKESEILSTYKNYKYKGPSLLNSGNTELFYKDILALDTT